MNEKSQTPVETPEPVAEAATRPLPPQIVVGVDGSNSSVAALRRGDRIASSLGVDLQAVAVWQYPVMAFDTFFPLEGWSPQDDAEKILADTIATVFGDDPPSYLSSIVRPRPVAQVLIEQSEGAEMLIVGSRGRGGFVGLLLGSVSKTVAEHAHCPVLVVREAKDGLDSRPERV